MQTILVSSSGKTWIGCLSMEMSTATMSSKTKYPWTFLFLPLLLMVLGSTSLLPPPLLKFWSSTTVLLPARTASSPITAVLLARLSRMANARKLSKQDAFKISSSRARFASNIAMRSARHATRLGRIALNALTTMRWIGMASV